MASPIDMIDGVSFTIALEDNRPYQIGERIPVVLRFSSHIPETYQLDAATYDRSGRLHADRYHLTPTLGWIDPLAVYEKTTLRIAGGIAPLHTLTQTPFTMVRDLNEYVRFEIPGVYTLSVTSFRINYDGPEGTHCTHQPVASESLTLHIVDADPDWAQRTLDDALRLIDGHEDDTSDEDEDHERAYIAARVLRFLSTEASTRAMAERFDHPDFQGHFQLGLHASPHLAVTLESLRARAARPDIAIDRGLFDTVAHFEARCVSDLTQPLAESDVSAFRDAFWDARRAFAQKILDQLLSSKQPRPRAQTLACLFDLSGWLLHTANSTQRRVFETIEDQFVCAFSDLPSHEQSALLRYHWTKFAHHSDVLAPQLLALYQEPNQTRHSLPALALQRYAELEPDDGAALIIREIDTPRYLTDRAFCVIDAFDALGHQPRADLDAALRRRLLSECPRHPGGLLPLLIQRFATSALVAEVRATFEAILNLGGTTEAAYLAFFLRADPTYALTHIRARLHSHRVSVSFGRVLRECADFFYTPALETLLVHTLLEHEHEHLVADIADLLQKHGSERVKQPLLARFVRFHEVYADRPELFRRRVIDHNWGAPQRCLQDSLWRALLSANGFRLDDAECAFVLRHIIDDQQREQVAQHYVRTR